MGIEKIIEQLPNNESISVRFYDSEDNLTYLITKEKYERGERAYKLYQNNNGILKYTEKSADSPLTLEDEIPA